MENERVFNIALTIVVCNCTTLAWVLIKIFAKYQEMLSPIGSYLIAVTITHIIVIIIMATNKKKLVKSGEKNGA